MPTYRYIQNKSVLTYIYTYPIQHHTCKPMHAHVYVICYTFSIRISMYVQYWRISGVLIMFFMYCQTDRTIQIIISPENVLITTNYSLLVFSAQNDN